MAQKDVFLHQAPLTSLRLLWVIVLAVCSATVDGSNCNPENADSPICLPTDDTKNNWRVELDCSEPNTVTVHFLRITDLGPADADDRKPQEVRLECSNDSTQAIAQVNCSNTAFGSFLEGTYTFINLNESGILPGWTCIVKGCTSSSNEEFFFHTPNNSCTLPDDNTITMATTAMSTTAMPTTTLPTTTTAMPTTSTVTRDTTSMTGASMITTDTTSMSSTSMAATDSASMITTDDDFMVIERTLIPITTILILLIIILLLGVIILKLGWIRQQKARNTALLVFDKQNMVFDPHYTPAVCIDKPALSLTHRLSVMSIEFLQKLNPTDEISYHVTIEHENADSSIPKSTVRTFSSVDVGNSEQQYYGQNGAMETEHESLSKELLGTDDGYVHTEDSHQITSSLHSDVMGSLHTVSDSPTTELTPNDESYSQLSDDISYSLRNSEYVPTGNDIVVGDTAHQGTEPGSLTDLMLNDNLDRDIREINLDGHHPSSEYVHSSGGYVQSTVPAMPTDSQNMLTGGDFELDLALSGEVHDDYDSQSSNSHCTTHDCETVHPQPFALPNTDQYLYEGSYEANGAHLDMSQSLMNDYLHEDEEAHKAQLDVVNGYVPKHPLTMSPTLPRDNESLELNFTTECQDFSGEVAPSKDECSQSVPSSQLHSCPPANLDSSYVSKDSTCEYVISRDITGTKPLAREIVVSAGHVSLSETESTDFTVHLDFDNGTKAYRDQVEQYDPESELEVDISGLNKTQSNDQGQYLITNNAAQQHGDNGHFTNKLSVVGITSKEQEYMTHDFHTLTHTVGDSYLPTLDFFGVDCETTDSSGVQHPSSINLQLQSTYYPSDASSGYRSESCTSGDTSLYLGTLDGLQRNELRIDIDNEEDS